MPAIDRRREAALYDWHNRHRLRRQERDQDHWARQLGASSTVAVLGAGTGRIATPLAGAGHRVLAVDLYPARLARLPLVPGLQAVCADFTRPLGRGRWAHVLFPYSALQLVPPARLAAALAVARDLLAVDGTVHLDLSDSFAAKPDRPWTPVLEDAECPELGEATPVRVTEEQRGTQRCDHYHLEIRYMRKGETFLRVTECWYHHPHDAVVRAAEEAGLRVAELQRGYPGVPDTGHRRLYRLVVTG